MFESLQVAARGGSAADAVRAMAEQLRTTGGGLSDPDRVDLLRALEALSCTAAAVQAEVTADFDASQRAAQAAAGVPAGRRGRGVAAQVALARRESPHRGAEHLRLATVLRADLPCTRAAFRDGRISEWKATLMVRETACLDAADRRLLDAEVAGNPDRIEAMGDRQLVAEVRRVAYRLDPHAVVARRRRAEADRNVTLRPAPDTMAQLSALLPVKDGVAVYAVLSGAADRARAAGDPRTRGQVMADTLVDRVLGRSPATRADDTAAGADPEQRPEGGPAGPGVTINVVLSDAVLYGASDEPGHLDGYGPIPADLARRLAAGGLSGVDRVRLRRLYARPETGALVAMDSHTRLVPTGLARFLRLRDRTCRTPYCDAPIRHRDHVVPAAEHGPTSGPNTQGLCEACNHAKQAPGWTARPRPGPTHTVETTTPTGHTYRSTAPPATDPIWHETTPGVWTRARIA